MKKENPYIIDVALIVDQSYSVKSIHKTIHKALVMMRDKLLEVQDIGSNHPLEGVEIRLTFIPFNQNYNVAIDAVSIKEVNVDDLQLHPSGTTDIGTPVKCAAQLLDERYKELKKLKKVVYHPLICLFTDGIPEGYVANSNKTAQEAFDEAAIYIRDLESAKKLSFVAFSFSADAGERTSRKGSNMLSRMTTFESHVIDCSHLEGTSELKLNKIFIDMIPTLITMSVTDDRVGEFDFESGVAPTLDVLNGGMF